MKFAAAGVVAVAGLARASVQGCTGMSSLEGGNYYCGKVNQVLYSNLGHTGTYKSVRHMDDSGNCEFEQVPYGGGLAPFNEDLSVHIRGPTDLKQFAVYNLGVGVKKVRSTSEPEGLHARRHGHQHFHRRHSAGHAAAADESPKEKRQEVWVTATIDGQVVSWINNYFGPTPAPANNPAPAPAPAPAAPTPQPAPADRPEDHFSDHAPQGQAGDWARVGYYHADRQVADSITFLGNYGGQGSGVFDYKFGNSLSYLNSRANGGAASPQILAPGLVPSNHEYSIFSDKKCSDVGGCGYSRPGSVAYQGFVGADKVFLFEFSMPLEGGNSGFNINMPAVWFLNGRIPRTQQYGGCSCWPACGEVDMFEVLDSGNLKCKSTVHAGFGGGASDFFDRPIGAPVKVAAVFDGTSGALSVKVLPPNTDFSTTLPRELVQSWLRTDSPLTSLFSVGG